MKLEFTDGLKVFNEILRQAVGIRNNDVQPKLVLLGSYSYYLLKDYYNVILEPKSDRYQELIHLDFGGFPLEILIHRDTQKEGSFKEKSTNIKVYG